MTSQFLRIKSKSLPNNILTHRLHMQIRKLNSQIEQDFIIQEQFEAFTQIDDSEEYLINDFDELEMLQKELKDEKILTEKFTNKNMNLENELSEVVEEYNKVSTNLLVLKDKLYTSPKTSDKIRKMSRKSSRKLEKQYKEKLDYIYKRCLNSSRMRFYKEEV
mmetsp:Transcript_23122/g.25680  ORF Transcript_23122/g.25680 Transcript_23122/m.25680 type:complete len:162 (-) Transcript_23122:126-611(-)